MSNWSTLEWIAALAGLASIVGTIFAGYALFRRTRNSTVQATAAEKSSTVTQTASDNSPVVMNSPGAVVVTGNLNLRPGYDIQEHERILDKRVAQVRSDMERAHEAEVEALRSRIDALTAPEWDRNVLNAVDNALTAKRYDVAADLMEGMEESHLAGTSIPATAKLVRIRQLRAAIALVSGDAKTASEHIEAAVGVLAPIDPLDALEFRNNAATHFQDYGERVGGDGIVEAVRMYRRNLEQLDRETHRDEWAETQHNLGNALLIHGRRAGELQKLQAAIQAFRAALQVCTPESDPNNWAQTQISLGGSLLALGELCAGAQGLDYLGEAVSVLREAATVRTRDVDPETWASIQSNLGATLSQQGVRRGGSEGVRLLREAVQLYRELLEVRTRDRDPLEWAAIQANLSSSLAQQASLLAEDFADLLNEAAEAVRLALQVYSKKDHPQSWASAQRNLGAILNEQAHRQQGKAGLEWIEAATHAFQYALEVYVREEFPVRWAVVQRNLSVTFLREAVLQGIPHGLDALSKAASVCHDALEVFTREDYPLDWAAMQFNLGSVLFHLGEWTGGAEGIGTLKDAASAFENVTTICVRETHPDRWADVHRCLGLVYEALGGIDPVHAIENYGRALREADHALEISPDQQRPDRFDNARAMRERVTQKLSAARARSTLAIITQTGKTATSTQKEQRS